MSKLFRLSISTAEKAVFDADVLSVSVPGASGFIGILADHAPLVSTLTPGPITLKDHTSTTQEIQVTSKGFLEVFENKVNILLDAVGE
jgi:F-type H+-transporting ATPase subunit epsilon